MTDWERSLESAKAANTSCPTACECGGQLLDEGSGTTFTPEGPGV